jgi:DNA modification methylase
VLDPFAGTGTTGRVAEDLGRNSIMVELSERYIGIIRRRTEQVGMLTKKTAEE